MEFGSIEAAEESGRSHDPLLRPSDIFDGVLGFIDNLSLGSTRIEGKSDIFDVSKIVHNKIRLYSL